MFSALTFMISLPYGITKIQTSHSYGDMSVLPKFICSKVSGLLIQLLVAIFMFCLSALLLRLSFGEYGCSQLIAGFMLTFLLLPSIFLFSRGSFPLLLTIFFCALVLSLRRPFLSIFFSFWYVYVYVLQVCVCWYRWEPETLIGYPS